MSISSTVSSSNREPNRDRTLSRRATILWIAAAIIPIVAVIAFAILQPVKVRPRIGLAPGYAFTDQNGLQLTSEDVRGKLTFYNFTYANCSDPCPQTTATMAQIHSLVEGLDMQGVPVQFVTISFDPDRDTPEALAAYAAQIDPALNEAGSNWRFVTGPAERLKNVIGGGFGVYYQPSTGADAAALESGDFTFDPTIIMVDGNGIMRAIYERDLPDMQTVERDVKLVVAEVKNSEGPGKLVYEAAHLFLCYPKS